MSRLPVILMVDDNADDVYFTARAFQQSGVRNEIVVARDGVEALDLLLPTDGRSPLCPAVVLLDINLPRLGGVAVLTRLRSHDATRSLPVIVLTSSDEDRDAADSCRLGANSYVSKPVCTDEFLAAVRALGVYWLGGNQQPAPSSRGQHLSSQH